MDIQMEVQKIHHQFGVTEKANYEIQKLFDKAIKEAVTEALSQHDVSGQFIKPLVWDDEPKEKHVYKRVSVAYVSLPVQGDWKSHIAICDEEDYGFKATVWLMNGGFGIAKYCRTIEEAKVEVAKWWADFVGGLLNNP
jgi:hypothetical protein